MLTDVLIETRNDIFAISLTNVITLSHVEAFLPNQNVLLYNIQPCKDILHKQAISDTLTTRKKVYIVTDSRGLGGVVVDFSPPTSERLPGQISSQVFHAGKL